MTDSKNAFKAWMNERYGSPVFKPLEHQPDCIYRDEAIGVPLVEYPCKCYDCAVFVAGWDAAKREDQDD